MSVESSYAMVTRAAQSGTGNVSCTRAVIGGGTASITLAANVLGAVAPSGGSHRDARLLVLHGPGDTSAPCHPQSGVTRRDADPDGAGA